MFPLCLGGNVFGWTLDERRSFAVLDAYADAGGNFVDTADVYGSHGPSGVGGSERIIGSWMAARGNRDQLVIATKVGVSPELPGLSRATVLRAAESSLQRLGTEYIDLYYSHVDDADTPLEETLGAYAELIDKGWVRHVGASNYSAQRLSEALALGEGGGLARFVALQPQYNLMERGYERELRPVVDRGGLACVPYYGLARGFLTGKYRPGGPDVDSPRAQAVGERYLNERGRTVLEALDEVCAEHSVAPAAAALAWLLAQPTVVAPIASARTPEQLAELLPCVELELTPAQLARLDAASAQDS